jgi:hypothetical protein
MAKRRLKAHSIMNVHFKGGHRHFDVHIKVIGN